MKQIILTTIAAAAMLSARAAINSPGSDGCLDRGRAMFADANYTGCIDQLAQIDRGALTPAEIEDADWLIANACYHVQGATAAVHFRTFLVRYPASLHRQEAMMRIGDCLMATNYAKALQQYQTITPAVLTANLREDLFYHMAYCQLKLADYDAADNGFTRLQYTKTWGNASRFYLGYIAYAKGDYARARELFATVNTDSAPGNMADYYLAQIAYRQGDYQQTARLAQQLLRRQGIDPAYAAEANRLCGESLYRLDRPSEAIPYLERYVAATDSPALSALYILGLSQYAAGDYTAAVASLSPVSTGDDAMGQSALLYIGQALLKQGDTDAALLSLDKALRLNHDPAVQEAAFYNYAVAKYRGGNIPFGSSVAIFEEFLRRYPDSKLAPEVQEYVIDGWLHDNNYEAALASINRMAKPGQRSLAAKQQVLYVLGSRALATNDAEGALRYLEEAEKLARYNADVARQVSLLAGEALYRQDDSRGAVAKFDNFLRQAKPTTPNYAVGRFDRAYAYFDLGEYDKAAGDFAYVGEQAALAADIRADALNRLADTRQYRRDFAGAAVDYRRAYQLDPATGDYPLFMQAVMKGYQRDFKAKKEMIGDFMQQFPESSLRSEALLELAETYHSLGDRQATADAYRQVISETPNTAQGRTACIRLGSLQLTEGRRTESIETFKQLISSAPTSEEAVMAVNYLERIGAEDGTLSDIRDFLAGIESAPQIDVAEADRISFITAQEAYDDKGSTDRLQAYVSEFPDGAFAAQALGYLLDDATDRGNDDAALTYARQLSERFPDNSRAATALLTIGDIELGRNHAPAAAKAYKALLAKASTADLVNAARMGLMRSAAMLGNWPEVRSTADQLLSSSTTTADQRLEAQFDKGLALEQQGNSQAARKLWEQAADNTDELHGAKSAYYLAQSLFDSGQTEQARKRAQQLTSSKTPHNYWLARGFILLSDIFRAGGHKYEADSYLEALRNNYPGNEADIFEMIDSRLANN